MIDSRYDKVLFKDVISIMHQGINTAADKVKYVDSGIPIIQSKHFTSGKLELIETKFIGSKDAEKYGNKYIPEKGDILFSNIGTVGKSVVVDSDYPFMFAWNVFLMKPICEVIINHYLQRYLDYLLKLKIYERWFTGGTVKFLNKKTIGNLEIPLPPLAEQKQIATILDAANSLRQKDQQLIEHYTALSQSLFLDMFGDPVTNPMGWKKRSFLEVFDTRTGKLDSNAASESGLYPFFTCAKEALKINSYSHDCEALLLAGNNAAGVFDVKYYKGKFDAYQRTYILTINNKDILYSFMRVSLEKKLEDLQRLSIGSSTQYLTIKILSRLDFIAPPIELQNQFAERIAIIEQQKKQAQASLEKSDALFNSLLQRAFSGELTAKKLQVA